MKIFAEKEAEKFLQEQGFEVIESFYCETEERLKDFLKNVKFPIVMKASGKNLIHKNKLGGVKVGVKNSEEALKNFKELLKIENAEGVLVQKQVSGKEYLFGIKKTPEFNHVLVFGSGGIEVEEKKDVAFRICPVENEDVKEMIHETKIGKSLNEKYFEKLLLKLCKLIKKYPDLTELDINPLIDKKIVDARIVFENGT